MHLHVTSSNIFDQAFNKQMKPSIAFTKFSEQECSTNENQLPSATLSGTLAKEINFNSLTDADQNPFIKSGSECYQEMELTSLDDEQQKTLVQNGPACNQEMELTNLDVEEQKTM
ncbi:uncharacterized protein LOC118485652 [Helianthus annuus]|uniref:uncharacterized protein LOC118485652 n=1 Tax=Helianthus annuus TaxID=4232 RepID=UPI001652E9FD|nr:uncharacterized protein LOC118485652 [Helianthus annuus]